MRLSEKLGGVLNNLAALNSESKPTDLIHAAGKAADLLRNHAEDLRQALRDSERLQAALVVGLSEGIYGPHTLEVDGLTAAQEVELNGQRVRLVIEDAAMGRREGEA